MAASSRSRREDVIIDTDDDFLEVEVLDDEVLDLEDNVLDIEDEV